VGNELLNRMIMLERSNKQLSERIDALQHVVSWLLAKHPPVDALRFLRGQSNELEPRGNFPEEVAILDELNEDVLHWHALLSPAQGDQQKNIGS